MHCCFLFSGLDSDFPRLPFRGRFAMRPPLCAVRLTRVLAVLPFQNDHTHDLI